MTRRTSRFPIAAPIAGMAAAAFAVLVPAPPAQADDLIEALAACGAIETDAERWACFDGQRGAIEARLAAEEEGWLGGIFAGGGGGASVPEDSPETFGANTVRGGTPETRAAAAGDAERPSASAALETTPEKFGATTIRRRDLPEEAQQKAEAEELDEITGQVIHVTTNALGRATLYLENGQVWRQNSNTRNLRLDEDTYDVKIRRGWFNSFFMEIDGKTVRVRRIR